MIIDKKGYETLEKQILEWEAASNVLDKTTQDVNKITRDLIKVLKKSDEKNLDTITAVLMFVIRSIMDGPDNVLEFVDKVCLLPFIVDAPPLLIPVIPES